MNRTILIVEDDRSEFTIDRIHHLRELGWEVFRVCSIAAAERVLFTDGASLLRILAAVSFDWEVPYEIGGNLQTTSPIIQGLLRARDAGLFTGILFGHSVMPTSQLRLSELGCDAVITNPGHYTLELNELLTHEIDPGVPESCPMIAELQVGGFQFSV